MVRGRGERQMKQTQTLCTNRRDYPVLFKVGAEEWGLLQSGGQNKSSHRSFVKLALCTKVLNHALKVHVSWSSHRFVAPFLLLPLPFILVSRFATLLSFPSQLGDGLHSVPGLSSPACVTSVATHDGTVAETQALGRRKLRWARVRASCLFQTLRKTKSTLVVQFSANAVRYCTVLLRKI